MGSLSSRPRPEGTAVSTSTATIEMQIYDSGGTDPPTDQDEGSLYRFAASLVDAARPVGQWQMYDLRFCAPRHDAAGHLLKAGSITAWLNEKVVKTASYSPNRVRLILRTNMASQTFREASKSVSLKPVRGRCFFRITAARLDFATCGSCHSMNETLPMAAEGKGAMSCSLLGLAGCEGRWRLGKLKLWCGHMWPIATV